MPKFVHHKFDPVNTKGAPRDNKRIVVFRCRKCKVTCELVRKPNEYERPTKEEIARCTFDRDCNIERVRAIMEA